MIMATQRNTELWKLAYISHLHMTSEMRCRTEVAVELTKAAAPSLDAAAVEAAQPLPGPKTCSAATQGQHQKHAITAPHTQQQPSPAVAAGQLNQRT